ncbi:MAG: hypothetical protein O2964_15930 [Verrucomicrobia bacterium]|nr:hypothetical protein [Verrucomicrobiota bacterium]
MPPNHRKRSKSRSWKRKLERKAGQSAFLFILVNKPGFRYTLLALILCFLGAGLYVAPLWNIAPETYGKTVRASLYRIHEARGWKEKAIAAAEQDDLEETAFLLRMALSRNSLDPDLYRMVLTNGMAFDAQSPSEIRDVALKGEQLLLLTATNAADLNLVLTYNRLRGQDNLSAGMLLALPDPTPDQVMELFHLLYTSRRVEDFERAYTLHAGRLPADLRSQADLYQTAVQALQTQSEENAVAMIDRMRAGSNSALERQLRLDVYGHLEAVDLFKEVFQEIQKNEEDQPEQHALYWKLLSSSGQLINARKLAAQYWPQVIQHRFIRLEPVVQLAKAYLDLGLSDRSWEVFQLVEPTFGDNPRYWMEFGDLLIEAQQWQDVISHAVKLRTQRGGIADTKVYAFFIEGLALGKQKMTMPATTAFKRLIEESPLKNATMVTRMAQGMVEVGHGDLALEFLALHDAMIEDRPVFFDLMFQAAKLAGNPAALSAAMKSLEEASAPAPVTAKRRLEKAVLMLDDTEQPLGTFLQVRSASDWSDSERLLVASARWLQGDVSGLEAQLNSIESESLASHEKALMTLIQFDRLVQLGRLEEARSLLILMEEDRLFPGYEAKLESLKIQLNTSPQESP